MRVFEPPFSWHGLAIAREGALWRLPEGVIDTVSPAVSQHARRASGARLRFATDALEFEITLELESCPFLQHMSLLATSGADIYEKAGASARFLGFAAPESYESRAARGIIRKSAGMQTITVNLPRNAIVKSIALELPGGAALAPAQPYAHSAPAVFYGSSITEGGAASRPGNAYTSLVCRALDCDYINLGFAGSARGEAALAEYIASLEMAAFVLDYDHNAQSALELERTHERFFRIVRGAQPKLPIVIMSRPNYLTDSVDAERRRAVIRRTFRRARRAGDRAVYFVDGKRLLAGADATSCTVDGIHPNDAGFMRMANRLTPVLRGILEGNK